MKTLPQQTQMVQVTKLAEVTVTAADKKTVVQVPAVLLAVLTKMIYAGCGT